MQIVEVVLRQGLVHPITCVPYLIALETDPQEASSKLAHHLLMNMNEKYGPLYTSKLLVSVDLRIPTSEILFPGILHFSKAVWVMAFRCPSFS